MIIHLRIRVQLKNRYLLLILFSLLTFSQTQRKLIRKLEKELAIRF